MEISRGIPPGHAYHASPLPVSHISSAFQQQQQQQPQPPPPSSSGPHQQHQQSSQQPQLIHHPQQHDDTNRARVYKSRNKRPCDFCRQKRAACHLESRPPCELCLRYGKPCTFVKSPAKRRRPHDANGDSKPPKSSNSPYKHSTNSSIDTSQTSHFAGSALGSLDLQPNLMFLEHGIPSYGMSAMDLNSSMANDLSFDPALYSDTFGCDTYEPMSATSSAAPEASQQRLQVQPRVSVETSPGSQMSIFPPSLQLPFDATCAEPSLDLQKSSNSQIVGLSGESDPYLFSRFHYNDCHETAFQSIRVRRVNNGPSDLNHSIPAFFTIQHNALASKAQPQERSDTVDKWRSKVEAVVSEEEGRRLFQLFYKYVQPYFPVLSREPSSGDGDDNAVHDTHDFAPCVLAAVYGHALAFCTWDEKLCVEVYQPPSPDDLFKIAWNACQSMLHTPNLSVMQALLLLVQRRPTNKFVSDTPFKPVMMSTAISIAQALGLNRDPSDWCIPPWEKRLRRRLAWAVYVQDKWLSLNFGRGSHILDSDWDVHPLTEDDFPDADRTACDNRHHGGPSLICQHFIKLCELTTIVDDIYQNLYSIKATKKLHHNLDATLERTNPLRDRLAKWHKSLPPDLLPISSGIGASASSPRRKSRLAMLHDLDGNGSLQLAYITAKIELFRAMLRPRVTDVNAPAVPKLRAGALAAAKEISDFVDNLNAQELEAFWASYARTNFTIASSFFVLLFVTSPSLADAKECLSLLKGWRGMLRVKSQSCNLLNLALLRLNGVFVAGLDRLIELSPAAQQAWNEAEPRAK